MTHLHGSHDADLHYEDGSHRGTPLTTDGAALARYETRIRAHLSNHAAQETFGWSELCEEDLEEPGRCAYHRSFCTNDGPGPDAEAQ